MNTVEMALKSAPKLEPLSIETWESPSELDTPTAALEQHACTEAEEGEHSFARGPRLTP